MDLRALPQTLDLSQEDPDAFAVYTHWLYHTTLPVRAAKPSQEENILLAKSYALGEMLMDCAFKNAVTDAFVVA